MRKDWNQALFSSPSIISEPGYEANGDSDAGAGDDGGSDAGGGDDGGSDIYYVNSILSRVHKRRRVSNSLYLCTNTVC